MALIDPPKQNTWSLTGSMLCRIRLLKQEAPTSSNCLQCCICPVNIQALFQEKNLKIFFFFEYFEYNNANASFYNCELIQFKINPTAIQLFKFSPVSCRNHGNIYCSVTIPEKTRGIQWIKKTDWSHSAHTVF